MEFHGNPWVSHTTEATVAFTTVTLVGLNAVNARRFIPHKKRCFGESLGLVVGDEVFHVNRALPPLAATDIAQVVTVVTLRKGGRGDDIERVLTDTERIRMELGDVVKNDLNHETP